MSRKPHFTPTKHERDAMLADAIRVLAGMLQERQLPSPKRIGDAVASSIALAAQRSRGSIRQGAALFDVPHTTFKAQIVRGIADACHYLPMHDPLDAALFPFIRIHWTSSDLGFLNQYVEWMVQEVQPRAHTDETKVVVLQNFTDFQGTPSNAWVTALAQEAGSKTDITVLRGIVVLAPDHPDIMNLLDPVNASKGEDYKTGMIRFASEAAAALDHAAQLFAAASVNPPTLSLD